MLIIYRRKKGAKMSFDFAKIYKNNFELYYSEDDFGKNFSYLHSLPEKTVNCCLKIKDDMVLAGLPFFFEAFNYISQTKIDYNNYFGHEGGSFSKTEGCTINFELPFDIALTGERLALNLLQRASSVATNTSHYVEKLKGTNIKMLDTRKTTPGMRFLEKYAVKMGGGYNHRFGQMDAWMVKDNHKAIFGGVEKAIKYFQDLHSFYQPIIIEIHDLDELEQAIEAGAVHFLLDNFSPDEIKMAIKKKKAGMTYEVSGGIILDNIETYIMDGVDAFSSGSMTYNAPQVDLSLKFDI